MTLDQLTDNPPKSTCPADAKKAARKDPRIVEIHVYPDGWVPNKYRWPKSGRREVFIRNGARQWKRRYVEIIDIKRSHGEGPAWVALSERRGVLARG